MAVTINGDGVVDVGGNASSAAYVRLYEDSDNGTNYVDLIAPASVASNRTITLPDATTTVVGTDTTQTLTNKTIQGGTITSATAQASTSGTSIDFTGIPSWVKRVTVMFSGVSTNGTSAKIIQIGDSGGIETSGYSGTGTVLGNGVGTSTGMSSGFFASQTSAATDVLSGQATISLLNASTNTWAFSGIFGQATATAIIFFSGGGKSLSDVLDRIRITTVNGTDTFDAGTINILYE